MVNFTIYYDHLPPLWEVVANIMSYFWQFFNCKKGCISVAVRSLLLSEPILGGTPCLPWYIQQIQGSNLYLSATKSSALITMIRG